MSVAINPVEGYDSAKRGCMQLANDCNGHYLPAEWSMNPTSRFISLQTQSTESRNWSDTFSQHLLALALHTLHFLCTEKHPHSFKPERATLSPNRSARGRSFTTWTNSSLTRSR